MADLGEAFNSLKFYKKPFQTNDYFFTQRTLMEDREYIDKNMNRKTKKVKVSHNFLALNIPTINTTITKNGETSEKPMGFDIEIFGDDGYHYKGTITSYEGIIPNFMVPIKGDKKLFINVNYNFTDSNNNLLFKKFVNFIEVPKRFHISTEDDLQSSHGIDSKSENE